MKASESPHSRNAVGRIDLRRRGLKRPIRPLTRPRQKRQNILRHLESISNRVDSRHENSGTRVRGELPTRSTVGLTGAGEGRGTSEEREVDEVAEGEARVALVKTVAGDAGEEVRVDTVTVVDADFDCACGTGSSEGGECDGEEGDGAGGEHHGGYGS